jgi:hypothetical protein
MVFCATPVADEICSMDLPAVIWLAIRASAGVRSKSACNSGAGGLVLGTIDVMKTTDNAPLKTSSPSPRNGTTWATKAGSVRVAQTGMERPNPFRERATFESASISSACAGSDAN